MRNCDIFLAVRTVDLVEALAQALSFGPFPSSVGIEVLWFACSWRLMAESRRWRNLDNSMTQSGHRSTDENGSERTFFFVKPVANLTVSARLARID